MPLTYRFGYLLGQKETAGHYPHFNGDAVEAESFESWLSAPVNTSPTCPIF